MSTPHPRRSGPNRTLGILAVVTIIIFTALAIVLPVLNSATSAPVVIFTSIVGIIGAFSSFLGAFPQVRDALVHSITTFSIPLPKKQALLPIGLVTIIILLGINVIQSAVILSRIELNQSTLPISHPRSSKNPTQAITVAPTNTVATTGYSIFFGSNDNHLYAITDTGKLLWPPYTTGSYVDSDPIIVGNTIYFGSQDAYFYGVNAHTGEQVCNFKMGQRTVSSPTYSNGLVYIGSQDHYIYAFTPDCQVRWKTPLSDAVDATPTISNGVVYICSRDNHLYALRADNGSQLWTLPKGNTTASVVNGIVYVGSGDNNLYALDANTGAEMWKYSSGEGFNSPYVSDGVLYVGTGKTLVALNAQDGSKIWSFQAGGFIQSLARVVNGVIYIGTISRPGYVYAIKDQDGSLIWQQQVSDNIYTSVAYANGILYFGSQDSSLYALNATDGSFQQSFGTNGSFRTNDQVNSTPLVIPSSQV